MSIQRLIELFCEKHQKSKIYEDFNLYEQSIYFTGLKLPSKEVLSEEFSVLPPRDQIFLELIIGDFGSHPITLKNIEKDLDEISHTISLEENIEEYKLTIKVNKSISHNFLSVYSTKTFLNHVIELELQYILNDFNKLLEKSNYIIFKTQDGFTDRFNSNSIYFNTERDSSTLVNRDNLIAKRNEVANFLSNSSYKLVPEDFNLIIDSKDEKLNYFFKKITAFLSLIFLADISSIEKNDELEIKINGYRQINDRLVFKEFSSNVDEVFKSYNWVYNEGNLSDKVGLARNIISINYQNSEGLLVKSNTFYSIKSGYAIYLKENVHQYIEVTNRMSEYLVDLTMKANDVIKTFGNSFRNNNFIVSSFFLSIIVFNSLSAGQFTNIFTGDILAIAIAILIVSAVYLLSSIYITFEHIKKFEKDYMKIKDIYSDLLNPKDLEKLFDNEYLESNKIFVKQKVKAFSLVWGVEIIIFAIMLIYVSNIFTTITFRIINEENSIFYDYIVRLFEFFSR